MSHADSEDDIWDAFDEATERAEVGLEHARANYEVVEQPDDSLPEVYGVALQELEAEIEKFDSIYQVTDAELTTAKTVAARADLLAAVTDAYRTYHETVIDRRVDIAGEWFDALETAIESEAVTVAADRPELSKQRQALQKLVDAGKYGRLLESDRVNLDDFEDDHDDFDTAAREALDVATYIEVGAELTASFHDRYTEDLSALVEEGVDQSAISVTDSVQAAPETDLLVDRAEDGEATEDDAESMGRAVATYADVARVTGRRRARYDLGMALVLAIEETSLVSDDVAAELREQLSTIDTGAIESRVAAQIEGEATTSDADRFRQLLAEHDGSVRRTAKAMDVSTDEVFDRLQDFYETGELADLEAKFE